MRPGRYIAKDDDGMGMDRMLTLREITCRACGHGGPGTGSQEGCWAAGEKPLDLWRRRIPRASTQFTKPHVILIFAKSAGTVPTRVLDVGVGGVRGPATRKPHIVK